jgi:hypothetical protein
MELDRIELYLKLILQELKKLNEKMDSKIKQKIVIDGDELLDNQDILFMLKISSRTLQRYRTLKKLPYFYIGKKLYYKPSDVHNFIRENYSTPYNRYGERITAPKDDKLLDY